MKRESKEHPANWVDFKQVKDAVSMQAVIERYGITGLKPERDELVGRCPIHKGEGERAFHVSYGKNCFQCFSCKRRGNVIDFVAAMEQCGVREAAQMLQQWFAISTAEAHSTVQKAQVATLIPAPTSEQESGANEPLRFRLQNVQHDHPYLAGRGITEDTADAFEVGYFSGRGMMSGRIVFPIHNEEGQLVAYAGRVIDEAVGERYKFPPGFKKSLELYNLHQVVQCNKDAARQGILKDWRSEPVILVEGFFGCLHVIQAGRASVALMGSSLSKQQEELLVQNFWKVFLLFDGDDAGRACTDDCLKRLGRRMWVRALELPDGIQPDQMSRGDLENLIG